MADLLVGVGVGIGSSLLAWIVVNLMLRPRIAWSAYIARKPNTREYRVKLGHHALRDAVDVNIRCTIRVRNLDGNPQGTLEASNYATIAVPLRGAQIDLLQRRRRRDMPKAFVPEGTSARKRIQRNRLVELLPEGVSEFQIGRFPEELRQMLLAGGKPEREELLRLGDDAYLDFTFYCYDGLTGARRVTRSHKYREAEVRVGTFKKQSLEFASA